MGINTFPQSASSPYTAGTTFGPQTSRPTSPTIGQSFYNGSLATFEIWNGSTWAIANSAPASVTSVIPTDTGSGRAYNNGRTSVAFTPSTVGGLATLFTVVSSPGAYSATGTSSPIIVTGLQSNTSYTYSVIASNAVGAAAGLISAPVTATTIPTPAGTPTAALITDGTGNISVSWAASATGGAGTTTSYLVTSSPGGITTSTTSTSTTMTGLTSGTAYTFTVVASNANGSAAASAASNSITSLAGPAINYLVVGGGASSFSVNGAGGGGGAVKTGTNTVLGTSWQVTVGAAGTANNTYSAGSHAAAQGQASQLASITCQGGGAGGYAVQGTNGNGIAGGNGGGGNAGTSTGTGFGGASNDNGYPGGNVTNGNTYNQYGGGGGAGGAGSGVNAGPGVASSITGTQIYYGPGGGGGVYSTTGTVGIDGMDRNASNPPRTNNGAGAPSGLYQGSGSRSGSAGIVVIQYPTTNRAITSIPGTLTYTVSTGILAGYYTYIFTAGSGVVTW
jgi:hypothetical protein